MRDSIIKVGSRVEYINDNVVEIGKVIKIDKCLFLKIYIVERQVGGFRFVNRVRRKDILEIANCD